MGSPLSLVKEWRVAFINMDLIDLVENEGKNWRKSLLGKNHACLRNMNRERRRRRESGR